MNNMNINNKIVNFSIISIFILVGLVSFIPLLSFWGCSHLCFLPLEASGLFWIFIAGITIITFSPIPDRSFENILSRFDPVFNNKPRLRWLAFSLAAMVIFYLFRVETFFLGDGYSWLSILGKGERYVHKWTEPVSLYLIRLTQSLTGEYTQESALSAFRITSIISGGIVIYNIFSIVQKLFEKSGQRYLALSTLLFSGHLLLYFGYVEFYAMSWAATLVFINSAISYLKKNSGILKVIIAYSIAMAIHLQAIYLLPAFLFLLVWKFNKPIYRKIGYWGMGISAVLGLIIIIWLYNTIIEFEVLLLPLFKSRNSAPGYTVFSFQHFYDILNLIWLVFPGALVLVLIKVMSKEKSNRDSTSVFLLLAALGSISFLFFYGAAITMGFDWDIMSLTLLAPILWILYNLKDTDINFKTSFIYSLLCIFLSISFLSVNFIVKSSEDRFHTLINNRHRGSWLVYANYYRDKKDRKKFREIVLEADRRFPQYQQMRKVYKLLEKQKFSEATTLAHQLADEYPYNADFLQLMGNLYGKNNQYDSSIIYYERAEILKPYNTMLKNELGQIYMKTKMYEKGRMNFLPFF